MGHSSLNAKSSVDGWILNSHFRVEHLRMACVERKEVGSVHASRKSQTHYCESPYYIPE